MASSGRAITVRDPFRGRYDLAARVVVDASGHTGFLAREAGLRPANDRSAVGMELELHAPGYDQDEVVFWLGDDVAPGGYGWAFPCGDGRVRLGVGVVRPDSDAEPRALLESLRSHFAPLAGAATGATSSPIEMHSGLMPVLAPDAATLVGDGLVVTGDAAGQGSTLLGEGIRYAILAGRTAGKAIVGAGGDYSARGMAAYPKQWRKQMGRNLKVSYAINERICRFGDADWDRVIRRMDALTPGQAAAVFASEFSAKWAASVLWTDPSLVRSVARNLKRQTR
jgi:digeranylgeranylglycerophospholipid reductase